MKAFDQIARFYDYEYQDFEADIPMYLGFAERVGGPILELACGTGRALIPLAQAGFEITGVDISEAMLAIARRKAVQANVAERIALVQADIRDFTLDREFHMAFCAVNSFMHLTTLPDQLAALRCWHRHLRPGGLLILDLFPPFPDELREDDGRLIVQGVWEEPETGITIVKQYTREANLAEQTLHIRFFYDERLPDGQVHRTIVSFTMRYLGRFEAELLLEKAGYEVEAVYGSWDLDPFHSEAERMILVARRV